MNNRSHPGSPNQTSSTLFRNYVLFYLIFILNFIWSEQPPCWATKQRTWWKAFISNDLYSRWPQGLCQVITIHNENFDMLIKHLFSGKSDLFTCISFPIQFPNLIIRNFCKPILNYESYDLYESSMFILLSHYCLVSLTKCFKQMTSFLTE